MQRTALYNMIFSRPFFLAALLIGSCILLKWQFAEAGAGQLLWLLKPTSRLVSLCTGLAFVFLPGQGYYNADLHVLIAPACAGLNFFIILLASGSVLAALRVQPARLPGWLAAIAGLSYITVLLVNTLRILIALAMLQLDLSNSPISPEQAHRLEGIVIYYVCLCLFVMLLWRLLNRRAGRAAVRSPLRRLRILKIFLPLGCYLLFTLGLPLANGALRKATADFALHSLTVLLVSCGLTLLFALTARRWAGSKRQRLAPSAITRQNIEVSTGL